MKGAAAAVLSICLAPTLYLLTLPVAERSLSDVLATERQWTLLLRSCWIALVATALAVAWGTVTALGIRALRAPWSWLLEVVAVVPLLLPSAVIVLGWVYFFGSSGPVAAMAGGPVDIFGPGWAAFVLSMCYFPFVTVLLLQGFRSLDPAWGAIARMHAGPLRTAWFVWRPLLGPYLATGAMLVFVLSLGDYGVPWALSVNIYPVEIFAQLSVYYDAAKALAYCLPPLLLCLVLVAARYLLVPPAHTTIGHRSRTEFQDRPSRTWTAGAGVVLVLAVLLPVSMLVKTMGSTAALAEALSVAGDNALLSLSVALGGTMLLLAGGTVFALALVRAGPRLRAAGSIAALAPLAIPGAAVGLGLVLLHRDGWIPRPLFQSQGILMAGLLCRLISFPALVLMTSFAAIAPRMTQAARLAGAGPTRTLARIVLPLAAPGLLAAALLSFLFCMGELAASAMISPPGLLTLSMRISSLLHYGEERIVAALCVTLVVLVLGSYLLGLLLLNRRIELNVDAHRS